MKDFTAFVIMDFMIVTPIEMLVLLENSFSRDVIDSYIRPEDIYYTPEDYYEDNGYDKWQDEYESDYYEALDEIINDDYLSYEIYPLKDNVTQKNYDKWVKENMLPRDFIRRCCRQLTEDDM